MNTSTKECDENGNEDLSNRLVLALAQMNEINEISKQFSSIQSASCKTDFVSELLIKFELLPKYLRDVKNNDKSDELRKQGNKLFAWKRDEEALELFTASVAVAENTSEKLGLAFANRSAVFFNLKMFDECLTDIERALQNNYPESLKEKLLKRQQNAKNLILEQKTDAYHQPIPLIPKERRNTLIESASDSVEIKSDPKLGRHIVATKDIQLGEVIAVERASFTVLTDKKWCHCHHCLTICYTLLPCDSCSQALFCSSECKNASKSYHDYECSILYTVQSLDLNPSRIIPLRIAILMKNAYESLENEINEPDKIYRSGRYKEIHNLVTNQKSRSVSNLFGRVTTVSIFYYLVKNYTDFFKDTSPDCEKTFKSLVLHHLQTMVCNFHEISDLEMNPKLNMYESMTVGCGAFSFLSLFNHSCAPNVNRMCYGTSIVLSAAESIKKGEQLFDNYGYHYATHSKSERLAGLKKQYFFDCECRACKNNWAKYDRLPKFGSAMKVLTLNYNKLANADLETAKGIVDYVRNAAKQWENKIPCKDFCEIQESLKQCYCIFGNTRRALKS